MKIFFLFFIIQFVQYGLITVNMRATAKGLYIATFISDLLIAGFGFVLIRFVSHAEGWQSWAGYALGGSFGSMLAIYLTKKVFREG